MVEPAGAVPVVAQAMVISDRLGAMAAQADQALITAYAAIRLGETTHAMRSCRHALAVAPFDSPFYSWMRRDILDGLAAAGVGPNDLTPLALDRTALLAILVELQQRHPVDGG